MKYYRFAARLVFYLAGFMCISAGIVLAVNANMGVSPGAALPTVVSAICPLSLGTCYTILLLILMVLQMLLLGKNYPKHWLLQVFSSFIMGFFTDFWVKIFQNVIPSSYPEQLLLIAISIVLQALGVALYIDTNIILMSPDGLLIALRRKLKNWQLGNIKLLEDCSFAGLAIICSLIFLGKIYAVREGTIILALCVGKVMGIIRKPLTEPLNNLFYGSRSWMEGHD